ncbi:Integral membrane sensor signal transduction histidine kinase [Candidatus Sulfopaludibacter sp. SbA3]|nr:Integral membrane sensor signal transduction histidine kinase [Candidatus Sulfopaludibacter sp. SbA3]
MRELLRSGTLGVNAAAVRRRAPWLVLWLGFGGLLICIIGAAAGTLTTLDRVRTDENRIRKSFLGRLSALDLIRSQIYLSGTYVRDFLLSPDPSGAAAQSARLAGLKGETQTAIQSYSHGLEPEEREPFLALQSEIEEYWRVLDQTIAWTPDERNKKRDSFFYDELVPRRTAMLQIADRIALVNEHGLNRSEEQLAASSGSLRRSLMVTFGITLAGGFVLALLTILYTLRLERELERRLEENTHARADLQELSARLVRAQENERRTLARELHDEVGQSLSAILMEAENAECADELGEIREHLASVRTLAEKTVNEVRDLALLLRPSMLDDFGLVPALNWHAREMTKRTGLNVVVTADDDADDLPDEHKTCIYRLVQEAVNNSARHANARTVEVIVKHEGAYVRFSVRDDGAGFDTRFVRGLGLLGMEERVRRLGGQLQLDSQLGRGTLIAAELPVVDLDRKIGNGNGNGLHTHTSG